MIKFEIGAEGRSFVETHGPADELAAEVLLLISTIFGEMRRADAKIAAEFRICLMAGLLSFSPVWNEPPAGEGVSMVIPIPDNEKRS